MSAHRRMRGYMERHKVGALFEDLMSKLVSEMPSEPVPFLIRVLQQKLCQVTPQTVMSIPQLRRSLGDIASSLEIEKVPVYHKPSSAIMKRSRPSTPCIQQPHPSVRKSVILHCPKDKTQEMEKPGVTNSPASENAPVQNQTNISANFLNEELSLCLPKQNQSQVVTTKTEPTLKPSPKYFGHGGYNGPILPGQVFDEDPLDDEILLFPSTVKQEIKLKYHIGKPTKKEKCISIKPYPYKNYPIKIQYNSKHVDNCGAVEMYEDPNDLSNEGIFIDQEASGFKVKSDKFQNEVAKCEHWHFNMCSVCAKILRSQDSTEDAMQEKKVHLKAVQPQLYEMVVSTFKKEISDADPSMNTIKPATDMITPSVINYFSTDERSPSFSGLDTDRTISTDDLFATPRSLPLPSSPVHKVTVEWCKPTLEPIHSAACGWEVVTAQDPDFF